MKFGVILGSVRPVRMSTRVGKMVERELIGRGHQVTIFDPAELNIPLLERPLHWYGPNEDKPEVLTQTYNQLKSQDAFVIITPEYNLSIPPALSNFIDHFPYDTWRWRCGSVISYSMGNFGGMLAAQQVRQMCSMISLVTLPSSLTLPNVQNQLDEDGSVTGERKQSIEKNLTKQMDELEFFANAVAAQKAKPEGVPFS